ncbi:MAG: alpha/beta hydrolase [Lachnospiraceae bacterium]|nr:alpha/beta hydrolase [Candidatus Equihabitans merdae]
MKKYALVFPGIGYHFDKPLLYYSKKIAANAGYEIVEVPYGGFKKGIKGNAKKMYEAFEMALAQTEDMLKDLDLKAAQLLFISKSIGTAVSAAYALKHDLKPKHICFTPVAETFQFLREPCYIFHGNADQWLDHQVFLEKVKETTFPYEVIDRANHSLETGNGLKDAENLQGILQKVSEFIQDGMNP